MTVTHINNGRDVTETGEGVTGHSPSQHLISMRSSKWQHPPNLTVDQRSLDSNPYSWSWGSDCSSNWPTHAFRLDLQACQAQQDRRTEHQRLWGMDKWSEETFPAVLDGVGLARTMSASPEGWMCQAVGFPAPRDYEILAGVSFQHLREAHAPSWCQSSLFLATLLGSRDHNEAVGGDENIQDAHLWIGLKCQLSICHRFFLLNNWIMRWQLFKCERHNIP